jgi:signal transduction histidine kinase
MGELASTVAHEVRNPLNAIAMSAQRLRSEAFSGPDADPESAALVDVIRRESERIDGRITQFLAFARPPVLTRSRVQIGPWLASTVEAVRPLAESRGLALLLDTAKAGAADIDAEQLRQVVDNLLRNAIDATPPGGQITVTGSSGSGELAIAVRDTGTGIAHDVLPKVFDLYFTTKAQGTGVGLAVSQQIVVAHGGRFDVDSTPGEGTTMTIVLPATP